MHYFKMLFIYWLYFKPKKAKVVIGWVSLYKRHTQVENYRGKNAELPRV